MKKIAIAKVCVSAAMLSMVNHTNGINVELIGRDYIFTMAPAELNDFKRIIMSCMIY